MAEIYNTASIEELKETAKIIKETLKKRFGVEIKHGWALEVSSAVYGYKNWDTASAMIDTEKKKQEIENAISSHSGFVLDIDFDKALFSQAKEMGLSKTDSSVKAKAIRQLAQNVGIGKNFLFTVSGENHNFEKTQLPNNPRLIDFGYLVRENRIERWLHKLSKIDAIDAPEIMKQPKVSGKEISSMNIFGVGHKAFEMLIQTPEAILDDMVFAHINSKFNDPGDTYIAYTAQNEEYQALFAASIKEILDSLPDKLNIIKNSSGNDYNYGHFMVRDMELMTKFGVDDLQTLAKEELIVKDESRLSKMRLAAKTLAEILITEWVRS